MKTAKQQAAVAAKENLIRSFFFHWRALSGPEMVREYRFHATRKWRLDVAHLATKTAIEIDGGTWVSGTRHISGVGFRNDCIKINAAILAGWRVFRLTSDMLRDSPAQHLEPIIDLIHRELHTRKGKKMSNLTKTLRFDDDVLAILRQSFVLEETSGQFTGRLTCGQLDRKMYERVNKALEAMGGKWNRSAKAHIFQYDPRPQVEGLLDNGTVEVVRDGWFPTPAAIVRQMFDLAGGYRSGYDGGLVLEPSAGEGHIVDNLCNYIPPNCFACIELNYDRAAILRRKGYATTEADFLSVSPAQFPVKFSRVFMNPPFENGQDIDHVKHAYEFLDTGGVLVSIMGEGAFFRNDKKAVEFREWLDGMGGYSVKLPTGSFNESGTGVSTRMVIITK